METNYNGELPIETDPQETASLKNVAQACMKEFQELADKEGAQGDEGNPTDRFWGLRHLAEFNIWDESPSSDCGGLGDDDSEFEYDSLSSSEGSYLENVFDDTSTEEQRQRFACRRHVEDSIDRLQGQAWRIELAGAQHRQRIAESFARRRIRFEYLIEHQKKRSLEVSTAADTDLGPVHVTHSKEDEVPTEKEQRKPQQPQLNEVPRPSAVPTLLLATVNTKYDFTAQPKKKERAESVQSVALRHPGFPPPPKVTGGRFQCLYCLLEFGAREAEKRPWIQHVMHDFEPYFCTYEACTAPFDVPNSFSGLLDHLQGHSATLYHVDEPNGEHHAFGETDFENHLAQQGGVPEDLLVTIKSIIRRKGVYLFDTCPFCGGYPDILEKDFPDPHTLEAQVALRDHIKKHMQDVSLFLPPYRSDIFDDDEDPKGSNTTRRQSAREDRDVACGRTVFYETLGIAPGATEDKISDAYSKLAFTWHPAKHSGDELEVAERKFQAIQEAYDVLRGDPNECVTVCGRASCNCEVTDGHLQDELLNESGLAIPDGLWQDLFDNAAVRNQTKALHTDIVNDKRLQQFVWNNILQQLPGDDPDADPRKFSYSWPNSQDRTLLLEAAACGKHKIVKTLIDLGADIEAQDKQSHSPLMLAATGGDDEHTMEKEALAEDYLCTMRTLLESGANLNARREDGQTTLFLAIEKRMPMLAQMLMQHQAHLQVQDKYGTTPLVITAHTGQIEIVKQLIRAIRLHLARYSEEYGVPLALRLATTGGHLEIVEMLIHEQKKNSPIPGQREKGF
ncbi:ankyrin [Bimuria novae-zelandiae CBS 107.79]|uniref:Ankyrin n=1 Tax=Bimuria novae-zelandiae CBS 107.79 TaxID=1447943 RepID=A0A6A5UZL4_9PLEO|nr:ankyrin [Bimuria novae-zelandiae CBS 107.79]